jgi:Protein of unknown function (DUF1194)
MPSRLRLPLRCLCCLAALATVSLAFASGAAAQLLVDLELVLAVDVSLSMDLDEQRLQRDGYVAALRDAEVHKAITSGPHGRIAVVYMEWAGPSVQNVVIPWTLIDGPAAAAAVADKLEAQPISRARMTSISQGLIFAGQLFDGSGVKGIRRVIDVSGDGPNNAGPLLTVVRDQLVAQGIAINGLPILLKKPASFFDIADLDVYYTQCVIGGTGAFMIPVRERVEFKTATRRKLLLEIAGSEPLALIRAQFREPVSGGDCTFGEQQWRRYLDSGPN